jgi:hypothetical protein
MFTTTPAGASYKTERSSLTRPLSQEIDLVINFNMVCIVGTYTSVKSQELVDFLIHVGKVHHMYGSFLHTISVIRGPML